MQNSISVLPNQLWYNVSLSPYYLPCFLFAFTTVYDSLDEVASLSSHYKLELSLVHVGYSTVFIKQVCK